MKEPPLKVLHVSDSTSLEAFRRKLESIWPILLLIAGIVFFIYANAYFIKEMLDAYVESLPK